MPWYTIKLRRCRHQGTFPQLVTHTRAIHHEASLRSPLNDYNFLTCAARGYGLNCTYPPISSAPFHYITGLCSFPQSPCRTPSRCHLRPTASVLTRKLDLAMSVHPRSTSHQAQWSRDTAWVTMESAQGCILGHVGQYLFSFSLVLREPTTWGTATWLRFPYFSFGPLTQALKGDTCFKVVIILSSLRKQALVQPFAQSLDSTRFE